MVAASISPTRFTPPGTNDLPEGVGNWMVKLDADPKGGIKLDSKFFFETKGHRLHQIRLEGGDASSDSYCFP